MNISLFKFPDGAIVPGIGFWVYKGWCLQTYTNLWDDILSFGCQYQLL